MLVCMEAPVAPEGESDQKETAVFETHLTLAYLDCRGNLAAVGDILSDFRMQHELDKDQ